MNTETTSAAVETTAAKQAWAEPTLSTLALSLETLALFNNGMDGGITSSNMT
jgi:hypothetical protein